MMVRVELDADRVAVVNVMVEEDMHYPLEDVRKREPTEDEMEEIRARLTRAGVAWGS